MKIRQLNDLRRLNDQPSIAVNERHNPSFEGVTSQFASQPRRNIPVMAQSTIRGRKRKRTKAPRENSRLEPVASANSAKQTASNVFENGQARQRLAEYFSILREWSMASDSAPDPSIDRTAEELRDNHIASQASAGSSSASALRDSPSIVRAPLNH